MKEDTKQYQVVYADPPWEYTSGFPGWGGRGKRRSLPYPSMTLSEIKALNIKSVLKKEGYLFLWVTNKYLEKGFEVVRSWGCVPRQTLVWCKEPIGQGLGGMFATTTEFLIVAQNIREGTNAHGTRTSKQKVNTSWFRQPRGRHSEKPDFFRKVIEKVCDGPYLELFAREKFDAWDIWGNELPNDITL